MLPNFRPNSTMRSCTKSQNVLSPTCNSLICNCFSNVTEAFERCLHRSTNVDLSQHSIFGCFSDVFRSIEKMSTKIQATIQFCVHPMHGPLNKCKVLHLKAQCLHYNWWDYVHLNDSARNWIFLCGFQRGFSCSSVDFFTSMVHEDERTSFPHKQANMR